MYEGRNLYQEKLSLLRSYPISIYHSIKELVAKQPHILDEAFHILIGEDTTICYEVANQFGQFLQFQLECLANSITTP